jgi:nucleotide-binding universal stress UspA family protein
MQIRRVLVPIDGSELSLQAVDAAAELAKRFSASMTLFTAVELPNTAMPHMSPAIVEEVRRGAQQAINEMLDKTASRARALQVEVEMRMVWGVPATAILEEAENGYDLIVMGSRGMSLAPRAWGFLGSVAERVLRQARCPVLIVPDPTEQTPAGEHDHGSADASSGDRRR